MKQIISIKINHTNKTLGWMAKETLWFKHDYNARNDIKTLALLKRYGFMGLGLYWFLVEMIHEEREGQLKVDEQLLTMLADGGNTKLELLKKAFNYCLTVGLFIEQDGFIHSGRVNRNKEITNLRSEAGKRGAEKRWKDGKNGKIIAKNSIPIANDSREDIDKNREEELTIKKEGEGEKSPPAPSKEDLLKKKQAKFYNSLVPHLTEYGKEMIRAFYDYWSEPNKSQTKQKWENEDTWELKRRLDRWRDRDDKWGKKPPEQNNQQTTTANRPL